MALAYQPREWTLYVTRLKERRRVLDFDLLVGPPLSDLDLIFFFFGVLAFLAAAAAFRRTQAASSGGNSLVAYAGHTASENSRKSSPSRVVEFSRLITLDSVCRRNFARPCQVDSSKRSLCIISSGFFGNSPSKTGIAHLYYTVSWIREEKKVYIPAVNLQIPEPLTSSSPKHFYENVE